MNINALQPRLLKPAANAHYIIKASGEDTTEIMLYDEIGYWGINAKQFVTDLKQVKTGNISLRINSPGGSVIDANVIFNALKEHPARVTTHIDGLAASAASYIALAGDEVLMASNAYFMIHDPWGVAIGTADEMRHTAGILDKMTETIAGMYVDATGQKESVIRKKMADETWFTADEALGFGFVDAIKKDTVAAQALFDVSQFKNIPSALKRDVENSLRDAGLSRKDAKAALAQGFDPSCLRDAGREDQQRDADYKELAALIRQGTEIISPT